MISCGGEIERAWRDEWGRLLALLVAQYRRLDLAEEGLADAFEAATKTWPRDGVPANAAGWLLTAARRRALDRLRAEAIAARTAPRLAVEAELQEEAQQVMADAGGPVHDERLRLVLLCAHPALAPEAAAALTLRLVLGVSTADIARLFLVPTTTMAARVTRARKRVAAESFALPEGPELDSRLEVAAEIAYLAFTAGYAPGSGSQVLRAELASEAIRLARVLSELAPARAELQALLALMLLQHSRRHARVLTGEPDAEHPAGAERLVLLPDQDRSLWVRSEIDEALRLLTPYAAHAEASPYLLQALIAAQHSIAPTAQSTDWPRIAAHYVELEQLTKSAVVRLNRAVAVAEADGPLAGLELLEELDLPGHRLPAVRGELMLRAGRTTEAIDAFELAITRCENQAEIAHLRTRRAPLRP